jgi:hypothetical protein
MGNTSKYRQLINVVAAGRTPIMELGMGIEPAKIGYFLARVELPICGDVSSLGSFFATFSPFFFFQTLCFPNEADYKA